MVYFLIGFKSCGKTTIGKRLAEKIAAKFVDLDQRIEYEYQKKHGQPMTFREIYQELGPDKFRQIEQQTLQALEPNEPTIISVGGATVMDEQNRTFIKKTGKVIYIIVEAESLYERIMANETPAFFDPDYPRKSFDRLYKKRIPIYESIADISVETTGQDIKQTTQKVYEAYKKLCS
jgi:shikimate kinase